MTSGNQHQPGLSFRGAIVGERQLPKPKHLVLLLTFLCCLIPINCASFGSHSAGQQYEAYSLPREEADLSDLFGPLEVEYGQPNGQASSSFITHQLLPVADQRSAPPENENYIYGYPAYSRLPGAPSRSSDQQLYELLLASDQSTEGRPSSLADELSEGQASPTEQASLSSRLSKLLASPASGAPELQQEDDSFRYDTDAKAPLLYSPADLSPELTGLVVDQREQVTGPRPTDNSNDNPDTKSIASEDKRNFTTLLEEDDEEEHDEEELAKAVVSASKQSLSGKAATTAVTNQRLVKARQANAELGQMDESWLAWLLRSLKSVYQLVIEQFPFINFIPSLAEKQPALVSTARDSPIATRGGVASKADLAPATQVRAENDSPEQVNTKVNTKPSVSKLIGAANNTDDGQEHTVSGIANNMQDNRITAAQNDRLSYSKKANDVGSGSDVFGEARQAAQPTQSDSSDGGIFLSADLDEPSIGPVERPAISSDSLQAVTERAPKVSLVKQYSLSMPLRANVDEPLPEPARSIVERDANLFGRLVQTPRQLADENQQQTPYLFEQGRLHPGDHLYGSYPPLYTTHGLSIVSDKANDVYYFVIVAAVCAMAMAVVLAAGLFAYRVQLNRQSSKETDYPSYGVVGPNNMSAKCGGVASIGGGSYFSGLNLGLPSGGKTGGPSKQSTPDGPDTGANKAADNKRLATQDQSPNSTTGRAGLVSNQNAAMYHYQHQKSQMILSDRASAGRAASASDLDSEDENDDGSYTVYECPGLASAHEMEIKNPLFNDDRTP